MSNPPSESWSTYYVSKSLDGLKYLLKSPWEKLLAGFDKNMYIWIWVATRKGQILINLSLNYSLFTKEMVRRKQETKSEMELGK